MTYAYKILFESLKGRNLSEDLVVYGRIILKYVLRKWGWRLWIGFIWLGIGIIACIICPSGLNN
jgi:hypothetical protein